MTNPEERLAKLVLNKTSPEDCFDIEYKGKTFKLGIRPLSGTRIIEVSEQICKCKPIEEEGQSIFHVLMANSSDLRHICKAIAIATETKDIKKVTKAILDLEVQQIELLWKILEKNSDAGFFLSIMKSARNLNLTKKKAEA